MDETKTLADDTLATQRTAVPPTKRGALGWGGTARMGRRGTVDLVGDATLAADATLVADATLAAAPPSSSALSGAVTIAAAPASSAEISSAVTMAADPAPSFSLIPAPTSISPRVTVLPRVEVFGGETRVVSEARLRYAEQAKLGEGGLGEVVGAVDQDIGRRVAVKRLRQEAKSDAALIRFAEEIRTIGKLEHPNIIPVHDVGVDERGDHFFVMKYVDGETLESIIEKLAAGDPTYLERFSIERRVEIFMALLEAVAFAHSRGIIHRDIKPANIMVGAYGEVVLMDWGIAKDRSAAADSVAAEQAPSNGGAAFASSAPSLSRSAALETQAGQLVGTPFYMSPEQARGEPVDERSDLYSLTLVFREMLALDHPLSEKRSMAEVIDAVIHEPVPNIFFCVNPGGTGIPAELGHFVHRGLQKDAALRFQTAADMLTRLRDRAEGEIHVECPVTFMKSRAGKWERFVDRHPVGAVVLAAFGAFSFVAMLVTCVVLLIARTA